MKLVKLLLLLSVVIIGGGFVYFAVTDAPIEQKQITKTISNERFFGTNS